MLFAHKAGGKPYVVIKHNFKTFPKCSLLRAVVQLAISIKARPLITISDLQKMKMFEVIVRRLRMPPFKTKLTPDFKMNWGRTYPNVDLFQSPYRERKEVKVVKVDVDESGVVGCY